jgi:hypothetical protein
LDSKKAVLRAADQIESGLTHGNGFESMSGVQKSAVLLLWLAMAGFALADTTFPSAKGTLWNYNMIQEFGEGIRPSEAAEKIGPDGKLRLPVQIFVAGTEKIGGVETLRYEMHRYNVISLIEYLTVANDAVTAVARAGEDGEISKLTPPQKVLELPAAAGQKWTYKGAAGDSETEQQFEIVGKESITVPAGKFDAFHLRLEQISPASPKVVEERWFVPDMGYAKIVTNVTRDDGRLLQRITLDLASKPKLGERPAVSATPAEKKALHAALAKDLTGEPTTTFPPNHPKIFARWQGETLEKGEKIRSVWIAEDVGAVAPPNYKLDEASTTANGPRDFGTFHLTKPNKGWPVGKYRVEFYAGDALVETVKFEIVK